VDEPNSGWIHCSYKSEDNRKQILRAYRDESGKTKYVDYNPQWKELRDLRRTDKESLSNHLLDYRSIWITQLKII